MRSLSIIFAFMATVILSQSVFAVDKLAVKYSCEAKAVTKSEEIPLVEYSGGSISGLIDGYNYHGDKAVRLMPEDRSKKLPIYLELGMHFSLYNLSDNEVPFVEADPVRIISNRKDSFQSFRFDAVFPHDETLVFDVHTGEVQRVSLNCHFIPI